MITSYEIICEKCKYKKNSDIPFNGNIKLNNNLFRYGIKCPNCDETIKFQYVIKNNLKQKVPILVDRKLIKRR